MANFSKEQLADLLNKAQTGNDIALQQLCKALEGFLRGYFQKRFQDSVLVDDLCQESYIRLLKNLPQVREEMKLTAFVAKIAFYVTQDYFRQKYRRQEERLEADYDSDRTAAGQMKGVPPDLQQEERILDKMALNDALGQLSEKSRKIMLLKYEGYNYEDISQEIGISVSGVKMQVKRSMEQLRQILFLVTFLMLATTTFKGWWIAY